MFCLLTLISLSGYRYWAVCLSYLVECFLKQVRVISGIVFITNVGYYVVLLLNDCSHCFIVSYLQLNIIKYEYLIYKKHTKHHRPYKNDHIMLDMEPFRNPETQ